MMGKLAQRLADPSRSGVYRVRTTEAVEEAAATNGYSLLRIDGPLPDQLPQVVLLLQEDHRVLEKLKAHALRARERGDCFFAALIDPDGKAPLAPLYNEKS